VQNRSKALGLILCGIALLGAATKTRAVVWTFDRLDKIGGHPTHIVGHPRVIKTPIGKAVEFNGVDDALFIDNHPLAGAEAYTWEVIFSPYKGGKPEQRFFHLAEQDPKTKEDTQNRYLFEIRVIGDRWCLDSFAISGKDSRALMDREKLHPLDSWYAVQAVFDGAEFRNYVNGELQGKGPLHLTPQGAGHSSVGVRINKVDYFKGAIRQSRFTPRALKPEEFLKVPKL